MSSELVRHEPVATLPEKMEWVRAMASASLLPRQYQNNPGNLLFAIEYADALGVDRMAAITSIHVIEGKPSASADLIANLVRKAGHKLRVSGDDTYAIAQIIRADDPDFTYEAKWDMDKARAANLTGKGVWKSYPGAMLRSRAITEVARMGASDALFGMIYTPEELGAEVDADGEVVHTVTTVPGAAPAAADRMRQALGSTPEQPPAEAVQEQPPVAPEDGITPAQVKKMATAMGNLGMTDRDLALAFVTDVIGRPVESRNDLTKREAMKVIDALERDIAGPPAEDIVDAELVTEQPDGDAIWQQIQTITEGRGWSVQQTAESFSEFAGGVLAADASASELAAYRDHLAGEQVAV